MQGPDSSDFVVLPWYERDDFEKLRLMTGGEHLPVSYDAWLREATAEARRQRQSGRSLRIVPLHVDDYFAWLGEQAEADTREARLRYLSEIADDAVHHGVQARSGGAHSATTH